MMGLAAASVKRGSAAARTPRGRQSEEARLHQQDERGAAQPAQQGELGGGRRTERPDEDQVEDDAEDERDGGLRQSQQDLVDEVAHRPGQTARRPWRARIRVTSSAYSRSPPTGRPRAIRLTTPTVSSSRSARYIAVASPSRVGLVARITSARGSPARFASSARTRRSRILRRSGPIPSIGEIAPWRTW